MIVQWGIIDLREEIKAYERRVRPFPPRSGSVSKPHNEPKPESFWRRYEGGCRWQYAGRPYVVLDFAEIEQAFRIAES